LKVLSIDTSSPAGSVAVTDGAHLMAELLLNVDYTHSRRLMRDIDLLLKAVGLTVNRLDGFALTLGPGSFTGLRIGVATIKGMAMLTDKPVAGVLTLDALAANLCATAWPVWALLDARKAEVFAARYEARGEVMARVGEPLCLSPDELARRVEGRAEGCALFLGSGVPLCEGPLRERLSEAALFAPRHLWPIRAAAVAALGAEKLARGETLDVATFEPYYIRPSEAVASRHGQTPAP
jgi:tRNA threonylcarbamoyladenosine biosynthesis protein TsaB